MGRERGGERGKREREIEREIAKFSEKDTTMYRDMEIKM